MKERSPQTLKEIIWKNNGELNDYRISHTPKQLREYANFLLKTGHLSKHYRGLGTLQDKRSVARIFNAMADEMEELGIFLGLDNPTWNLIIEKNLSTEASFYQMYKSYDNYTEGFEWESFIKNAVKILHIEAPKISKPNNNLEKLNQYRIWWSKQLDKMSISQINQILESGHIGEKLTFRGRVSLEDLRQNKILEKLIASID